jgi:hypothetical protein
LGNTLALDTKARFVLDTEHKTARALEAEGEESMKLVKLILPAAIFLFSGFAGANDECNPTYKYVCECRGDTSWYLYYSQLEVATGYLKPIRELQKFDTASDVGRIECEQALPRNPICR